MSALGQVNPSGGDAYQNILQQILQQGAGAGWNSQKAGTTLDQYGTDFSQQFQNAVGRAPTADEINQFYQQAVSPIINTQAGFSATDPNAVVSQYVPQAFQSQIQQNQQAQLPDLEKQLSGLASTVGAQTAQQLSDPTSQAYSGFSGALNNLGITPGSGAFQAGVGGTIGNAATSTLQSLLGNIGGGTIAGNQSPSLSTLSGIGQNAEAGMTGYNQQLNDFNLESQLGQMLAQMSQPSTAQKDIGMASGAANAVGGLGKGAAGLSQVTWICTQLKREGLLKESQIKVLHWHLYKAFWKRPFKFIGYILFGKLLVLLANKYNTNWRLWKSEFYDNVMTEPDPVRAVDMYADAFWRLYGNILIRKQAREYHGAQ